MRGFWFLLMPLAMAAPCIAHAFEIQKAAEGPRHAYENGVEVVRIGALRFQLVELSLPLALAEVSTSTEKHAELKAQMSLGDAVSGDEAAAVVRAHFQATAFDFDSVQVRDFKVGERTFVVWCSNIWLFGCLEWRGAAGTWVEYEVNGKNRSGGMTGFKRTVHIIRKAPAPGPTATAAPAMP